MLKGKPIAPRIGRYPPLVIARPETVIASVMSSLCRFGVRHAPIVDEEARPVGMVTSKDIVNFIGGGDKFNIVLEKYNGRVCEALMNEPVKSIMHRDIICVRSDDNLAKVVDILMNKDVTAVPVVDETGMLVGIISEKHIARLIAHTPVHIKVSEVMTKPVISVTPATPLIRVEKVMISKDIRRIVVENDKLVGIATVNDILRYYCRHDVVEALRKGFEDWIFNTPIYEIANKNVVTAKPDMEISEAMKLMRRYDVGGLPVVDENNVPVGIITERDILLKLPKMMGVDVFVDVIDQTITIGWIFY